MKLSLITPPVGNPVDLSFAKAHSRIFGNAEDALIDFYIATATSYLDGPTGVVGRCFLPQTWQIELPGWLGPVGLRVEPVQSVTVFYRDETGVEQELPAASYDLDNSVGRAASLTWIGGLPRLAAVPWPVRIEIQAGQSVVDTPAQLLVLMQAADMYERRESQLTGPAPVRNEVYDDLLAAVRRKL